jgi:pyroglutamyl-peptidase
VSTPRRRPPKILLTGFEPFGGDRVNPSLAVAQALDGAHIGGAVVVSLGLPVSYADASAGLIRAVEDLAPAMVVGLGQASGITGLALERIAVNLTDSVLPDNGGVVLREQPVAADGPAAYFSTLPLARLLTALHAGGFPAALSSSAGHYVCNHVFYTLLHHLAPATLPAGFVHLPLLPQQAVGRPGLASLPEAVQVEAVRALLEAARAG